jgi:hypothetical protein
MRTVWQAKRKTTMWTTSETRMTNGTRNEANERTHSSRVQLREHRRKRRRCCTQSPRTRWGWGGERRESTRESGHRAEVVAPPLH